ncbi:MAG TPA: 4a-hydroxytetrahydrobiopterin dehydratase [Acidimicrobiales bacterium]
MPKEIVLDGAEVAERMAEVPSWEIVHGALHRELEFTDFSEAFGFMTRVAMVAEKLDHHPDWSNSWNRVVIDVASHQAGGLTPLCFQLASAIDRVVSAPG